jgi:transmembrane protein 33
VQTWIVRALADENFQYLCLALFWFTTKPPVPRMCLPFPPPSPSFDQVAIGGYRWQTDESVDAVALVPYLTFSAFHVATFIRTTVIPMVFPPTPGPNGQLQPHSFAKTIQVFVKSLYISGHPVFGD